jgi:glycosyltransferase involved in cell wall biosynthesis
MNAIITYAIPYYRGLDYLQRAIQSVINQENSCWLLQVLDDCGGEDAEELVSSFRDHRITYVRNEKNIGLAGNWNKALSLAKTELVTLLHADDELEATYTDEIVSLMLRHSEAVAGHCRATIIDESGRKTWSLPDEVKKLIRPRSNMDIVTEGEEGLLSLVKGAWIFCPSMCYRVANIPAGGFTQEWKMVLDVELMSRILLSGGEIVGTTKAAYRYRRHATNQTQELTKSTVRFQEEIAFLDIIAAQCSERGWNRAARSAHRKTIVRLHLMYQSLRALINLNLARSTNLMVASMTLRFR